MTFRKNTTNFYQSEFIYIFTVLLSLVLIFIPAFNEIQIIFIVSACLFALLAVINPKLHNEFITIDETGISCRRSSNLLWSYQWDEIAQLKKGQRFLHPSVEVIVFDKQGNKEPFAGADKYFQLSKSAKTAIKKYFKGNI